MKTNEKRTKQRQNELTLETDVDRGKAPFETGLGGPLPEHADVDIDQLAEELSADDNDVDDDFDDVELLQKGEDEGERKRRSVMVRTLNDFFRISGNGGQIFTTPGFENLPDELKFEAICMLRTEQTFDENDDPWHEHDFGTILIAEHELFWKIYYYDIDYNGYSPDPSDPAVTSRVLTIMLASEY